MNFYDTITSMDYKMLQSANSEEKIIEIVKEDKPVEIHIIFFQEHKKIWGFLQPNSVICDIDDMAHAYKLFRDMKKDVKKLAEKSKYEVVE